MIINLTRTCISYNVKLPKGQIPLDGHGPDPTRHHGSPTKSGRNLEISEQFHISTVYSSAIQIKSHRE